MSRSMVPSLSERGKISDTKASRDKARVPMSAKTTDWVPAGSEPRCERVNPPLGSLTQTWKDFFPAPSSQTRNISIEVDQD